MKLVYLEDGSQCYLIETIGDKFIVNQVITWEDDEGRYQESYDSTDRVVDKVFNKAPTKRYSDRVASLKRLCESTQDLLKVLGEEKRALEREVRELKTTQINVDKFIINRSDLINAQSLALFRSNYTMPLMLSEPKNIRGLKVVLQVEVGTGNTNSWAYYILHDGYSSGEHLCKKYGILINPTQDEIDLVIRKRLEEFTFNDHHIKLTPDEYLSPELLAKKRELLQSDNDGKAKDLESKIQKYEEELAKLRASRCLGLY